MISDRLKALKDRSGITVAQWSELANIPADTINKILSGQTKNPGFQTVCDLVIAAGGTMDEILGIKTEDEAQSTIIQMICELYESQIEEIKAANNAAIHDLKEYHASHIAAKDQQIADLIRSRKVIRIALAVVIVFMLAILAFDLINSGMGYIRY